MSDHMAQLLEDMLNSSLIPLYLNSQDISDLNQRSDGIASLLDVAVSLANLALPRGAEQT